MSKHWHRKPAARDIVKSEETAHALELLQSALTAPLVSDTQRSEIESRITELKAPR